MVLWGEKSCYWPFLILADDNFISSSSLYTVPKTELCSIQYRTNKWMYRRLGWLVLEYFLHILYINSMNILLSHFHDGTILLFKSITRKYRHSLNIKTLFWSPKETERFRQQITYFYKSIIKRAEEALFTLFLWHSDIVRKAHSPLKTDEVTKTSMI